MKESSPPLVNPNSWKVSLIINQNFDNLHSFTSSLTYKEINKQVLSLTTFLPGKLDILICPRYCSGIINIPFHPQDLKKTLYSPSKLDSL